MVSVSTHVLDIGAGTTRARSARGALGRSASVVAAGETDGDGRIAELARDLEPGRYELVFWPPSPFFTRVELEIELVEGHYHIPLLVSPYGCVTYRGS